MGQKKAKPAKNLPKPFFKTYWKHTYFPLVLVLVVHRDM